MTDNDFSIDPEIFGGNRRGNTQSRRRPVPPGQTRHVYEGEEELSPFADEFDGEDVSLSDDEPEREEVEQQRRPARKGNRRVRGLKAESEETPGLVKFLMDRRISIWLGIVFILVGGATLVILLSYLKTGALDQTLILNMSPEEIAAAGLKVKSGVGPVGAWFGHVLFAESFGIGAFVVAVYFLTLGWKLLFAKKFSFWGLTLRCALLAISISIVVGLVTYAVGSTTFWGGIHGHYVNKWMLEMTGVPGAIFLSLLLIGTVMALYANELLAYKKKLDAIRKQRRLEKENRRNQRAASPDETLNVSETDEVETKTATDKADRNHLEENNDATPNDVTPDKAAAVPEESVAFVIDAPVSENVSSESKPSGKSQPREDSEDKPEEPGFEIDVPEAERGKNHGSVAERLVAEQGEYNPRAELSRYKFPTLDMLKDIPVRTTVDITEQQANKDRIIKTLANYNITIDSIKATVGPTVTLYEIVPTKGIRISQIKRLEDDIALSLAAKGIRIIAPMPGKGTVGIEVPNNEPQVVSMRSILGSKTFTESKAKLPVAIGSTISNDIFVTDLAAMPHALVAGATGQGKSVGLNVLISSLLFRKHPSELKFVLIDPKMVEFSVYERLSGHYLASLPDEENAIVTDPSKVLNVLNSLCVEMDNRYALLRDAAVNKIEDYNHKFCQRRLSMDKGHRYLPYIVVIIDEFADLIMTGGREIEMPVMRITAKARAVGIHMIIATQRPSTNVLTGLIKANCPSRIAFRVLQNVDSRTILDRPGAEQLIGRGDMLYSQGGDLERVQCAFISSAEIESICDFIDKQPGYDAPYALPEPVADAGGSFGPGGASGIAGGGLDRDPLFDEAARFIVTSKTASTSSLQRRFEIGYNRAGKIMDQMEAAGIVGPASGSKPRAVFVDPMELERILANR